MKKGTLTLSPVCKDSVWYVQWAYGQGYDPEGEKALSAWRRYQVEHSAGKDALGRFYNNKAHAQRAIKDFKKMRLRNG